MNKITITALIFALVTMQGGFALAEGLNVNSSTNIDLNIKSDSSGANINGSANIESDDGNDDTTEENNNENKSSISIEAKEIHGWDTKTKTEFLGSVKAYAELKSNQDLENFAKGVIAEDEQVQVVNSDDSSVEVSYKLPAKFLGIFKTTIDATVDVSFESTGNNTPKEVTVKFPWYRLFYSLSSEAKSDVLENSINSAVNTEVSGSANIYSRNGQAIQIISDILKEIRLNSETKANVE